jgi:acetyltransferase EpsM
MGELKKIIIIGAGQQGKIAKRILSYNEKYSVLGFLDDARKGKDILGTVKNFRRWIDKSNKISFFVAIGDNKIRRQIYEKLSKQGVQFANAIHPSAHIESGVHLGNNVTIGAFSYINIGSKIGSNTIVNNGCIIEHDNIVGANCHIAPRVATAGGVKIKDGAFIGLGSTIRDRMLIGKNCLIGAGSNILSDTEPNSMYFGNPARFIKKI